MLQRSLLRLSASARPLRAPSLYPTRTVTILTPFAAGSVTDAAARVLAQALSEALGQTFVVENRAGAGGLLAANAVARAKGDGYTLLLTTNSTHSALALFKSVPYDPIKDFTPIARIGNFHSFIAVTPDKPYQSMQRLVAYAKANPGKLSYGVGNSTSQIVGETLKKRTGTDILRVAYRSIDGDDRPARRPDPIMIAESRFNTGMPQLKAGKVKALAVLTREPQSGAARGAEALRDARDPRNGYHMPRLGRHDSDRAGMLPGYHDPGGAGARSGGPSTSARRRRTGARRRSDRRWSGRGDCGRGSRGLRHRRLLERAEGVRCLRQSELASWTAMIKEAGIEPQ